jgi:exoribonuclease R
MPSPRLVPPLADDAVTRGLVAIRQELRIDPGFPPEVLAAARAAAARPVGPGPERRDATEIPFVTIDPAGSTDLDQAYHAVRHGRGCRVHYAIADVAAFVDLDGPIAAAALARGVTLYAPDERAPLYPAPLGEAAASLLPDGPRPALVWTLELDADGALVEARVERAVVRSREQLSYAEAQRRIDAGTADEPLQLLRRIGELRLAQEAQRGAVSLALPEQELVRVDGGYRLMFRATLPVERWNAQISLLTGIAAAGLMCRHGVGLLRTLPPPTAETVATLRRAAAVLHIDWPETVTYAERVRTLDPHEHRHAAFMHQAARLFRGAGYVAFDGTPPAAAQHAAIASTYAHVTAPLRRVGDRYANDVVLALCAGRPVPDGVLAALPTLPSVLGRAQQRQGALDRAVIDFSEAAALRDSIGQVFDAAVVNLDPRRAVIEITDHAIVAEIAPDGVRLGDAVRVQLCHADDEERRLHFRLVPGDGRGHGATAHA